jgi:hypothetical protein
LLWTFLSATKEASTVLVELGLMEQRYRAVSEVFDDAACLGPIQWTTSRAIGSTN